MTTLTPSTPSPTPLAVRESQVRVAVAEASAAIASVTGMGVDAAVGRLRFGPGRTCEQVARVIDRALARADRAGIGHDHLVIAGGSAEPGEDIVRIRRHALGNADWISTPTSDVRIELLPAGIAALPIEPPMEPPTELEPEGPAVESEESPAAVTGRHSDVVIEALYEVLDPDLGINIVDLGFVRDATVDDNGVATITMTLTSPTCPVTGVMEDQIRTALLESGRATDFRVDCVWRPAWRPADITDDGREQLRAIGFSSF